MGSRGSGYGKKAESEPSLRYDFQIVNGEWEVTGDDYQPLGTVTNPKVIAWLNKNSDKLSGNVMSQMKKDLGDVALFS